MNLRINDRIRNRDVEFFSGFNVSLRYDAVASSFAFSFLFNPDNKEHKEMACVSHYHIATLEHNGETLLTGYILSQGFNNTSKKELCGFSGYSLPGVLEDCNIPLSAYPLQNDGLTLREIAQKLISPFGLSMIVDSAAASKMDEVFDKTTAQATESIKSYLTQLAEQKNIVVSHTPQGALLFTQAKTSQKPILNFDGGIPFTSMNLTFNGQAMHSDITVMKQADSDGGNAGESTVKNPYVPYVFRPKVVIQNSGTDNDTEQAAKNILASELRNLTLTIVTDRWEVNGNIIKPNNIISVINPEVYLYKKTDWFIEQIDFVGDAKRTTAALKCVLPEVYNNQTPKYIFEGINTH